MSLYKIGAEILLIIIWLGELVTLIKPDILINITIKELRWSMKPHGLDADIRPTPKTKLIYRTWSFLMLILTGLLIYMVYETKLI